MLCLPVQPVFLGKPLSSHLGTLDGSSGSKHLCIQNSVPSFGEQENENIDGVEDIMPDLQKLTCSQNKTVQ